MPLRLFSHLLTHFWQEIASFSLFPFHNPLTARLSDYIHARHANIELHMTSCSRKLGLLAFPSFPQAELRGLKVLPPHGALVTEAMQHADCTKAPTYPRVQHTYHAQKTP